MDKYKITWTIAKAIEIRAKNNKEATELIKGIDLKSSGSYIQGSSAIIDVSLIEKAPKDPLKE